MNTVTDAPKPTVPMVSMVKFLAQSMQRAEHFDNKDDVRAKDIRDSLVSYVRKHGPSGSGLDAGTHLFVDTCRANKLVFTTDFHHMNEHGYYDGWTQHKVIVLPTFDGLDVRVSGKNRNDIRDYLADLFAHWLGAEIPHPGLVENL